MSGFFHFKKILTFYRIFVGNNDSCIYLRGSVVSWAHIIVLLIPCNGVSFM